MELLRNEEQRINLVRFFKTGKGDYGEGDEFLGLKVPQTRMIVKQSLNLPLHEVPFLLTNRYHEIRLCGFLILVEKFARLSTKKLENDETAIKSRDEIVELYLFHASHANNWDLVDLSAPGILGRWLLLPTFLGSHKEFVDTLANSEILWHKRISMVCTMTPIRHGNPSWCLHYAVMHLHHTHDLMHKAVGWMLREMGKHVSMDLLRKFLSEHAATMPRTTLRYAIEHMDAEERKYWMNKH